MHVVSQPSRVPWVLRCLTPGFPIPPLHPRPIVVLFHSRLLTRPVDTFIFSAAGHPGLGDWPGHIWTASRGSPAWEYQVPGRTRDRECLGSGCPHLRIGVQAFFTSLLFGSLAAMVASGCGVEFAAPIRPRSFGLLFCKMFGGRLVCCAKPSFRFVAVTSEMFLHLRPTTRLSSGIGPHCVNNVLREGSTVLQLQSWVGVFNRICRVSRHPHFAAFVSAGYFGRNASL